MRKKLLKVEEKPFLIKLLACDNVDIENILNELLDRPRVFRLKVKSFTWVFLAICHKIQIMMCFRRNYSVSKQNLEEMYRSQDLLG